MADCLNQSTKSVILDKYETLWGMMNIIITIGLRYSSTKTSHGGRFVLYPGGECHLHSSIFKSHYVLEDDITYKFQDAVILRT